MAYKLDYIFFFFVSIFFNEFSIFLDTLLPSFLPNLPRSPTSTFPVASALGRQIFVSSFLMQEAVTFISSSQFETHRARAVAWVIEPEIQKIAFVGIVLMKRTNFDKEDKKNHRNIKSINVFDSQLL